MQQSESRFHCAREIEIHCHQWLPEGDRRRWLLVVHGAGEHGGWNSQLADAAVRRGWAVVAPDLRGHGRSTGQRGHVERFDDYVDDLQCVVEAVGACPSGGAGASLALFGHSMGGLIASRFVQARGLRPGALVLSSPLFGLTHHVSFFWRALSRLLNVTVPRTSVSTGIREEDATRDVDVQARRLADELRHDRVTARWFEETTAAMGEAFRQAPEVRAPLLLMQAGDDRIVSAEASRRFFERVGSRDKTFRLFADHYHELLDELDRAAIIDELLDWLDERVPAGAVAPTSRPESGIDRYKNAGA